MNKTRQTVEQRAADLIAATLTADDTPLLVAAARANATNPADHRSRDVRQTLTAQAGTYRSYLLPHDPWQLAGSHHHALWWQHDGDLLADLPLVRNHTQRLLDQQTRDRIRQLIEDDPPVDGELAALRVLPLAAPLRAVAIPARLPLRPQPLTETDWSFDLQGASR